jgi:fumarylacetoacetate (FAA) hydrolase family protein
MLIIHYDMEVGIGPDAEVFTKSQPMSAVGIGSSIGIHPKYV